MEKLTFEIGVNRSVRGKLPPTAGRGEWLRLNRGFTRERLDVDALARLIQAGHAITAVHSGPDGRSERKRENFISAQHIGLDFDTGDDRSSLDHLLADPFIRRYAALAHTTASHTPQRPRARVIFVLDRPVRDAQAYSRLAAALVQRFPAADPQCTDASRLWFGASGCECRLLGGVLPLAAIGAPPPARSPQPPPDPLVERIPGGQRNSTLTRIAGRLRWMGLSAEELQAALLAINARRCKPPLPAQEVRQIARSVARYPAGPPAPATAAPAHPAAATPAAATARDPNPAPPAAASAQGSAAPAPASPADPARRFVDECCLVGSRYRTPAGELYAAYRDWRRARRLPPQSGAFAYEDFRRLGFARRSLRGRAYWYGVGLKSQG